MKLLLAVLLILGLFNTDRYVINEPVSKTQRQTVVCAGATFKLGDKRPGDCLPADPVSPGKGTEANPRPTVSRGTDRRDPVKGYIRKASNPEIERLIIEEANRQGYRDVKFALDLADCESRFNPKAKNTSNNNPSWSVDRGLAQFNSHWYKQVTDECAYDPACAVKTLITELKKGYAHRWVCSKIVRSAESSS